LTYIAIVWYNIRVFPRGIIYLISVNITILTAGHFVTRRVAADSFAFAPRDTADGKSNRPRFVSDSIREPCASDLRRPAIAGRRRSRLRKILRMPKASAVKVSKLSI